MKRGIRNWRERWDPTKPLVFMKKLLIGEGYVFPGDPVTKAHREKLGIRRLYLWWDAGFLCLKSGWRGRKKVVKKKVVKKKVARRSSTAPAGDPTLRKKKKEDSQDVR